ncbi:hypothetical protein NLX83_31670 [Allokutzneria sp. A3M-2-11 16]|uniref:hypothetical protein n=1 Tax=Allokutzneria sp. A3M-2-11 16 TaxID=2962043 RepID=UPI0020B7FE25|nr:hypothetical protein [Allokutzneria sp. A3M-2-11 16]MCP3803837.1 hypothetical protein [Allokutzneria sp. A3M-2-11 16]
MNDDRSWLILAAVARAILPLGWGAVSGCVQPPVTAQPTEVRVLADPGVANSS